MKNWQKHILTVTAAFGLAFGCSSLAYAAELNVNGTGIVLATPDTAQISLTVQAEGKTSSGVQKEANQKISAIKNALYDLGIAEEEIITTYTSFNPTYRYDEKTDNRILSGYRSYTDLQITTKDIDDTGKYIDAALQAGATGTDGVSFYVKEQSPYYTQALQLAMKNAEKSAEAIAASLGKPLGEITNVTEVSRTAFYEKSANVMNLGAADESAMEAGSGGTSIDYGKLEIAANLTVTYDI